MLRGFSVLLAAHAALAGPPAHPANADQFEFDQLLSGVDSAFPNAFIADYVDLGCSTSDRFMYDFVKWKVDGDVQPFSVPLRGQPPTPRVGARTVVFDGRIFSLGGYQQDNTVGFILTAYDTCTGKWYVVNTRGPPPPFAQGACVAQFGPMVFVYGGWEKASKSTPPRYFEALYVLNLETMEWSVQLPSTNLRPPVARFPLCVADASGFLYLPLNYNAEADDVFSITHISSIPIWRYDAFAQEFLPLVEVDLRNWDSCEDFFYTFAPLAGFPLSSPLFPATSERGSFVAMFGGLGEAVYLEPTSVPIWKADNTLVRPNIPNMYAACEETVEGVGDFLVAPDMGDPLDPDPADLRKAHSSPVSGAGGKEKASSKASMSHRFMRKFGGHGRDAAAAASGDGDATEAALAAAHKRAKAKIPDPFAFLQRMLADAKVQAQKYRNATRMESRARAAAHTVRAREAAAAEQREVTAATAAGVGAGARAGATSGAASRRSRGAAAAARAGARRLHRAVHQVGKAFQPLARSATATGAAAVEPGMRSRFHAQGARAAGGASTLRSRAATAATSGAVGNVFWLEQLCFDGKNNECAFNHSDADLTTFDDATDCPGGTPPPTRNNMDVMDPTCANVYYPLETLFSCWNGENDDEDADILDCGSETMWQGEYIDAECACQCPELYDEVTNAADVFNDFIFEEDIMLDDDGSLMLDEDGLPIFFDDPEDELNDFFEVDFVDEDAADSFDPCLNGGCEEEKDSPNDDGTPATLRVTEIPSRLQYNFEIPSLSLQISTSLKAELRSESMLMSLDDILLTGLDDDPRMTSPDEYSDELYIMNRRVPQDIDRGYFPALYRAEVADGSPRPPRRRGGVLVLLRTRALLFGGWGPECAAKGRPGTCCDLWAFTYADHVWQDWSGRYTANSRAPCVPSMWSHTDARYACSEGVLFVLVVNGVIAVKLPYGETANNCGGGILASEAASNIMRGLTNIGVEASMGSRHATAAAADAAAHAAHFGVNASSSAEDVELEWFGGMDPLREMEWLLKHASKDGSNIHGPSGEEVSARLRALSSSAEGTREAAARARGGAGARARGGAHHSGAAPSDPATSHSAPAAFVDAVEGHRKHTASFNRQRAERAAFGSGKGKAKAKKSTVEGDVTAEARASANAGAADSHLPSSDAAHTPFSRGVARYTELTRARAEGDHAVAVALKALPASVRERARKLFWRMQTAIPRNKTEVVGGKVAEASTSAATAAAAPVPSTESVFEDEEYHATALSQLRAELSGSAGGTAAILQRAGFVVGADGTVSGADDAKTGAAALDLYGDAASFEELCGDSEAVEAARKAHERAFNNLHAIETVASQIVSAVETLSPTDAAPADAAHAIRALAEQYETAARTASARANSTSDARALRAQVATSGARKVAALEAVASAARVLHALLVEPASADRRLDAAHALAAQLTRVAADRVRSTVSGGRRVVIAARLQLVAAAVDAATRARAARAELDQLEKDSFTLSATAVRSAESVRGRAAESLALTRFGKTCGGVSKIVAQASLSKREAHALECLDVDPDDIRVTWWIPPNLGHIPPAVVGGSVVVVGDKLYAFGGVSVNWDGTQTRYLNTLSFMSLEQLEKGMATGKGFVQPRSQKGSAQQPGNAERWAKVLSKSEVPTGRAFASMTAVGNYLLMFGGVSIVYTRGRPEEVVHDDLWIFEVASRTWTRIDPIPASNAPPPRYKHAATAIEDYLLVTGGVVGARFDQTTAAGLYIFDIKKRIWMSPLTLPEGMCSNCTQLPGVFLSSSITTHGPLVLLGGGAYGGPDIGLWVYNVSAGAVTNGQVFTNLVAPNASITTGTTGVFAGARAVLFGGGMSGQRLAIMDTRRPGHFADLLENFWTDMHTLPLNYPVSPLLGSSQPVWYGSSILFYSGALVDEMREFGMSSRLAPNLWAMRFPICREGQGEVGTVCLPCSPGTVRAMIDGEPACVRCASGFFASVVQPNATDGDFVSFTCPTVVQASTVRSLVNPPGIERNLFLPAPAASAEGMLRSADEVAADEDASPELREAARQFLASEDASGDAEAADGAARQGGGGAARRWSDVAAAFVRGQTAKAAEDEIVHRALRPDSAGRSASAAAKVELFSAQRAAEVAQTVSTDTISIVSGGVCAPGFFGYLQAAPSALGCLPCPLGYFASTSGSARCVPCNGAGGASCPPGSTATTQLAPAENTVQVTEYQPVEHEDSEIIERTQKFMKWFVIGLLIFTAVLYLTMWVVPITYNAVRRLDMWDRGVGQSYVGGIATLLFLFITIPLLILQSMPALTGKVKAESAYKPYHALDDNVSAVFMYSAVLHNFGAGPDGCQLDCSKFPSSSGLPANQTMCYGDPTTSIQICTRNVLWTKVSCAARFVRAPSNPAPVTANPLGAPAIAAPAPPAAVNTPAIAQANSNANSQCHFDLQIEGFQLIRRLAQEVPVTGVRVNFGGSRTSASSIELNVNTTAAWPDQVSGVRFLLTPRRGQQLFRGAEGTVAVLKTFAAQYESDTNGTKNTGYLVEVSNFTRGSTLINLDFGVAPPSVDTLILFDLQSIVYDIQAEDHLSLGLCVLLGLALWTVMIDIFSWIIDAWEIIALRWVTFWMAQRHFWRSRGLQKGLVGLGAASALTARSGAASLYTDLGPGGLGAATSGSIFGDATGTLSMPPLTTAVDGRVVPNLFPTHLPSFIAAGSPLPPPNLSPHPGAGSITGSVLASQFGTGVVVPGGSGGIVSPYGLQTVSPYSAAPMDAERLADRSTLAASTVAGPNGVQTGFMQQHNGHQHDAASVWEPSSAEVLALALETPSSIYYDPTREAKPWFKKDRTRPRLCIQIPILAISILVTVAFLIFYLNDDPLSQL